MAGGRGEKLAVNRYLEVHTKLTCTNMLVVDWKHGGAVLQERSRVFCGFGHHKQCPNEIVPCVVCLPTDTIGLLRSLFL